MSFHLDGHCLEFIRDNFYVLYVCHPALVWVSDGQALRSKTS